MTVPTRRRLACVSALCVALLATSSGAALAACGGDGATSGDAGSSTSLRGRYTEDLERLAPDVLEGSERFRRSVATIRACVATIGSPACPLDDLAQVEAAADVAAEMETRIDALPSSIADPDARARAAMLLEETSAALGAYQVAARRFSDGGCAEEGFDVGVCFPPLTMAADAGRDVERLLAGWEDYTP